MTASRATKKIKATMKIAYFGLRTGTRGGMIGDGTFGCISGWGNIDSVGINKSILFISEPATFLIEKKCLRVNL